MGTYATCKQNDPNGPNGLGCTLCEQAVAAGVAKGTTFCEDECSHLGPIAALCKTACDNLGEVCEKLAHEDCPEACARKLGCVQHPVQWSCDFSFCDRCRKWLELFCRDEFTVFYPIPCPFGSISPFAQVN